MSNTKIIFFLIVAVVLLGLVLYFAPDFSRVPDSQVPSTAEKTRVEEYVRANISSLSPEPAVLGGTFYVTEVSFPEENIGLVSYEDGHIALTADFVFDFDQNGQPIISSFEILDDVSI